MIKFKYMKSNCIKFILFAFLLCIPFSCEKANLDEDLEQIDEPDDDDGGGTGSGTGGGTGGNTGKKDGKDLKQRQVAGAY